MSHILLPDTIALNLPDDLPEIEVPPEPVFPPEPIVPPEPIRQLYSADGREESLLDGVPSGEVIDLVFDFG